ncbi:MAG: cytochrome-c peroxidase [Gemmatimonadota bacterium]
MIRGIIALALLLLAGAAPAQPAPVTFTEEERARILAHGPWPSAPLRDSSNRVSGNRDAIDLGRRLFSDAALSRSGYIGCVTCHQPDRALTDLRPRAHGMADVDRNTPALVNLRQQRWFGWAGTSDSLWMASIRPLLDPREFDSDAAWIVRRFSLNDDLACRYRKVFGRAPDRADDELLANVGKALAAFEETLVTGRTPFDEFRDALARGDAQAMQRYPAAARRGLALFIGRGNCFVCHSGPNFSNGEFHDIGIPFFIAKGKVDPGRHEGIRTLRASVFNLLGRFNDDASRTNATATRHVALEHRNWGEFRTPSLRNVAVTPPYMHNGSLATLRDVVLHYSELDGERLHADGERILRKLNLAEEQIGDLVAFLDTLTDADGERRLLPPLDPKPCE